VTFLRAGIVWVAPPQNGLPAKASEWFRITEECVMADKPRWSPDGSIIYYISARDGFVCLWAQRVDRLTKRPVEPPFPVRHFHAARLSMMNVGYGGLEISVGRDMIVLDLGELMGNLWASSQE
jgi:hypothetical protein